MRCIRFAPSFCAILAVARMLPRWQSRYADSASFSLDALLPIHRPPFLEVARQRPRAADRLCGVFM